MLTRSRSFVASGRGCRCHRSELLAWLARKRRKGVVASRHLESAAIDGDRMFADIALIMRKIIVGILVTVVPLVLLFATLHLVRNALDRPAFDAKFSGKR